MVSNAIYLWWLKEDWVETSRATSRRSVGVVGGAYQWLRLNGRSGERLRLSGRFEEETRVAAHGRLPTDAILRPPAAYRRIAAGQAKKVTGPAD